jgi:hypothetical protein
MNGRETQTTPAASTERADRAVEAVRAVQKPYWRGL